MFYKKNLTYRIFPILCFILFILFLLLIKQNFDLKCEPDHVKNHLQLSDTLELSPSLIIDDIPKDLNETGFAFNIVPNIVHYVLFEVRAIEFSHFISILSVLKNQKPDQIYIHCDCDQLNGDYYERAVNVANKLRVPIIIRKIEIMDNIFGHKLNKEWFKWHFSDITRIRVLQEFGGIYLDRDVYVVKSLDVFRKYEMTVNWDIGQYLGNQVQIGYKNARFLKLYLDSYHEYDPSQWYFNAGELPTRSILYKRPELIHRVKKLFGVDGPVVCPLIFSQYYKNWEQDFYTIHLVIRGDEIVLKGWCFGNKVPPITKFNESIAIQLNVTFGEMTRILFDFEKQFKT